MGHCIDDWKVRPEDEIDGMTVVGWRCMSPDHDCLVPHETDPHHLLPNHHAYWVPVYARNIDLEEGEQ